MTLKLLDVAALGINRLLSETFDHLQVLKLSLCLISGHKDGRMSLVITTFVWSGFSIMREL